VINDLTIHMMVKNEERYIRQTLRSVLPHADAAIIIDTGSDDETFEYAIEICSEYQSDVDILVAKQPITQDSRVWDGNHLNQELTNLRNQMLGDTDTKWVWQVDGDEIYTEEAIKNLESSMKTLDNMTGCVGLMVPIKWCVDDEHYVHPGPFDRTLRVFKSNGYWSGEFPNEFYHINNRPITISDDRCATTFAPFLHMSMALHPERRPPNGTILELSESEKQCLSI
jgi:glycosyltransferase involved in cell wall biosynthesis